MKTLWVGIAILAVLLGLGIGGASVMGHVHRDLSCRLEAAADQCQVSWKDANILADSARKSWEQHQHWIAALVDHEPLEEIESLFSQLELSRRSGNAQEFAAVCLRIASICNMLEESHSPYWWNLL